MPISTQQKREIFEDWLYHNPQFKKKGNCLYRLNDFILTTIELRFTSLGTYYPVFIQTHAFYENSWSFSIDSEKSFRFSLGRHPSLANKYGIKYLGNEPDIDAFCLMLKRETIVNEHIGINDIIYNYESYRGISGEIPPLTMYALCMAYYYKGGLEYAVNKLDYYEKSFDSLFPVTKDIYGGKWSVWRSTMINGLNFEKIENNRAEFLKNNGLKLVNYPINL